MKDLDAMQVGIHARDVALRVYAESLNEICEGERLSGNELDVFHLA